MRTQNSLRSACASGDCRSTTCTTPEASRRSTNVTPPWSRRRATQPASVTVWPTCVARSVPASWVRITGSLPRSGCPASPGTPYRRTGDPDQRTDERARRPTGTAPRPPPAAASPVGGHDHRVQVVGRRGPGLRIRGDLLAAADVLDLVIVLAGEPHVRDAAPVGVPDLLAV